MPHEIETTDSLVLRDREAWHGLGKVISEDITAVEACRDYGMEWEVAPWEVFAKNPDTNEMMAIEEHRANVRMIETPDGPTPNCLGIVGSSYQICQNRELAEFMDALAQTGEVVIETAGSIRGGKRVWFLARSDSFEVAGGDESYSYLLGSNAHDGSGCIRLDPTDIRVVCANTLRSVIPDVGQSTRDVRPAAITVRHTGKLSGKLEAARTALAEYGTIRDRHRALASELSSQRIDSNQAMAYFADRYAAEFTAPGEGDALKLCEARTKKMNKAAAAFMGRYNSECARFGGESAWLAMNAWTGYCQHDLSSSGTNDEERRQNRIRSSLFGTGASRTARALASACHTFLAV